MELLIIKICALLYVMMFVGSMLESLEFNCRKDKFLKSTSAICDATNPLWKDIQALLTPISIEYVKSSLDRLSTEKISMLSWYWGMSLTILISGLFSQSPILVFSALLLATLGMISTINRGMLLELKLIEVADKSTLYAKYVLLMGLLSNDQDQKAYSEIYSEAYTSTLHAELQSFKKLCMHYQDTPVNGVTEEECLSLMQSLELLISVSCSLNAK